MKERCDEIMREDRKKNQKSNYAGKKVEWLLEDW